jgi:flavin reductase (DIM6/NTAB) family NADH-FMN oxidoreductase RutF
MLIDLAQTDRSWQDIYRLIISFVNPRPIALVSTIAADGTRNLAPFSFYNMVSANPPIGMVCPSRKRGGEKKDTQRNIEATGEFVVAAVTMAMAEKQNQASAAYPPEVDEFAAAGFTPLPATRVRPALVAESPVNCEYALERIVEFGEAPGAGAVIFGHLLAIHVDERCLAADGLCDPDKLQTIGRMGRDGYCRTTDRFDLPRAVVQ